MVHTAKQGSGQGQKTGPNPFPMQPVFWDLSQAWGCHSLDSWSRESPQPGGKRPRPGLGLEETTVAFWWWDLGAPLSAEAAGGVSGCLVTT